MTKELQSYVKSVTNRVAFYSIWPQTHARLSVLALIAIVLRNGEKITQL